MIGYDSDDGSGNVKLKIFLFYKIKIFLNIK